MKRGTLLWIGITLLIWMAYAMIITVHEYFFLSNFTGVLTTVPMQEYSLVKHLIAAAIWGLLGGSAYALLEIFVFQRFLSRLPFVSALGIRLFVYFMVLSLLNLAISLLYNSLLVGRSALDPEVWHDVQSFIFSISFWHPVVPFILLAIVSSLLIHLSERIGGRFLWKLLTGHYLKPREEHRIFMFLDLNGSTQIAEQLGNKEFYHFLNDFFHDISSVIIKFKGEVVEYVGDQVVITWSTEEGSEDARCLHCFAEFQSIIESNRAHYVSRYHQVPDFKAAIHTGKVMVGEIGRLKRSIKFSGDVLNTTARLEKLCKGIGAKLAISDALCHRMPDNDFRMERVRNVPIRGKKEEMDVYKVLLN